VVNAVSRRVRQQEMNPVDTAAADLGTSAVSITEIP
jgi:hypothetical protein